MVSKQLEYYHKKKQDPEWYAKELERKREYHKRRYDEKPEFRKHIVDTYKQRYHNDPDFREHEKKKALDRYYKKKEVIE